MRRSLTLLVAGAAFLTLHSVSVRAYSALYVFGDSLSDAGNVYLETSSPLSPFPAEPAAPYVNGQFSNGPIWVEDLSKSLGLGLVTPSLGGGNDYAYGGATTGYGATLSSPSLVPTLTQQVNLFLGAANPTIPSSALYSVWIGSNDVFNIISSGVGAVTAGAEAQGAAQAEATAIAKLAAAGAKDFLVPLVGDLGVAPTLGPIGSSASMAGRALSLIYDAALEADLAGLAATPGIDLSYLDTFTLLDDAVADPGAYGFTNVTSPCYTGPYTGGGSGCADPNQYLFWDELHPTAAGHALIGQAAFDVVPEPATLVLLATSFAAVAALRLRPRRVVARV